MKSNVETYVHITTGTGEDAQDSVKPEKAIEKLSKDGKQFTEVGRQAYSISEFESLAEFESLQTSDGQPVSDEIKLDMINRAWILRQQQTARADILSEDRTPSAHPIDLLDQAVSPRERRQASTETKAKNNLQKLAKEDPEAFAALLQEFQTAMA